MLYKDLQDKGEKELKALTAEKQAFLRELRMKSGMNQLPDVRSIREARKDIARMKTKLTALTTKE